MGEVVLARRPKISSPTLHPPSPLSVKLLSCSKVSQCIDCRDQHFKRLLTSTGLATSLRFTENHWFDHTCISIIPEGFGVHKMPSPKLKGFTGYITTMLLLYHSFGWLVYIVIFLVQLAVKQFHCTHGQ